MSVSPDQQLRIMVASDLDPVLNDTEIEMLLQNNTLPSVYSVWAPSTAYELGNKVVPILRNGYVFEVVSAGTSGTVQPPFSEVENEQVTDDGVTWELFGLESAYNLNRAAAEGWRIKAGKVANRYAMKNDVHSLARDQMYKHCQDMRKTFLRSSYGTVPVVTEVGALFP